MIIFSQSFMKKLVRIFLKFLDILVLWIISPLALIVGISSLYHNFSGSTKELIIRNEKQESADVLLGLYRQRPWYHDLVNPIATTYFPLYLVDESLIRGEVTLENIQDGDELELYFRRNQLPLVFTFQGKEDEILTINWELIGKKLDEQWAQQCEEERRSGEGNAFLLANPQNTLIELKLLRQDGKWDIEYSSWVVYDKRSIDKYNHYTKILKKDVP